MDLLEQAKAKKQKATPPRAPVLKHPMAPMIIGPPKRLPPKKELKQVERVGNISFDELADSSEFKRLVYLIWFGKTHRGKGSDLDAQMWKRQKDFESFQEIAEELGRGTMTDAKAMVKELKEVLNKRKEMIE